MYLSVIIPTYNESQRLPKTLLGMHEYFKRQGYAYELIVVDDGSTDDTVRIATELKASIPGLAVIGNSQNHGKGHVVRQGLLVATGQYRLFADADNSTPIEQVGTFLPFLGTYDMVIASRQAPGAILDPPQPFIRRLMAAAFRLMVSTLIGLPGIKDTQCGFKLMTRQVVETVIPKCVINGWLFDVEILKIAQLGGFSIKEAPVLWKNNTDSKVRPSHFIGVFSDLLRLRRRLAS